MRGGTALAEHDPGGIEPLEADRDTFAAALVAENHTLKRTLTDPHLFAGIGNAYSDEIVHSARLSPVAMSRSLSEAEITRLYEAMRTTLLAWIERGRQEDTPFVPFMRRPWRSAAPTAVHSARARRPDDLLQRLRP